MGNGREVVDVRSPTLPVLDLTALTDRPTRQGPAPRLLVVDDEIDVREWLRVALGIQGWDVAQASSAEEALEVATTVHPHVVVLDQQLPGASGIDCARQLRQQDPQVRLLLFSAYLDEESRAAAEAIDLQAISKVDRDSFFRVLDAHFQALMPQTSVGQERRS